MLKATVLFAAVTCALPAAVAAQTGANFNVGDRLRVSTADRPAQTGRVSAVDVKTLELQPDNTGAPVSIPRVAVTRIEISGGIESKRHAALRLAIWTGVISAVAGAISLGLQHDTVGEEGSSVVKAAALGAYSGALFGGLIGAGIGATRGGEQWEQVWPKSARRR